MHLSMCLSIQTGRPWRPWTRRSWSWFARPTAAASWRASDEPSVEKVWRKSETLLFLSTLFFSSTASFFSFKMSNVFLMHQKLSLKVALGSWPDSNDRYQRSSCLWQAARMWSLVRFVWYSMKIAADTWTMSSALVYFDMKTNYKRKYRDYRNMSCILVDLNGLDALDALGSKIWGSKSDCTLLWIKTRKVPRCPRQRIHDVVPSHGPSSEFFRQRQCRELGSLGQCGQWSWKLRASSRGKWSQHWAALQGMCLLLRPQWPRTANKMGQQKGVKVSRCHGVCSVVVVIRFESLEFR